MEWLKAILGDELFAQLEKAINEHNGSNIFMSISRYMNIDRIMPVSRFRSTFPSIFNGYNQSLCKMYIPTVFEYKTLIEKVG